MNSSAPIQPPLEHDVDIEVDGQEIDAPHRHATPRSILALVGKSADSYFLVQLRGRRDRVSYEGKPDEAIDLHEGERFITVATHPTPVS